MKYLIAVLALTISTAAKADLAVTDGRETLSSDQPGVFTLDSVVSDKEVAQNLTGAEWVDVANKTESATAIPSTIVTTDMAQNANSNDGTYNDVGWYDGDGWYDVWNGGGPYDNSQYSDRWNGRGWRSGLCFNGHKFEICFGGIDGRYGRGDRIACYSHNTRSGVTFRAQAPVGYVSAYRLQSRALENCRMNSRPLSCRASGCTRIY